MGANLLGAVQLIVVEQSATLGVSNVRGLVGGPEIMDFACSGAGDRSSACHVPWKLKHLSDETTERGTAVLVASLGCYVVCNVFVFIVGNAVLQDGKRVVALCVSLMDGSHQSYVGRCCGII